MACQTAEKEQHEQLLEAFERLSFTTKHQVDKPARQQRSMPCLSSSQSSPTARLARPVYPQLPLPMLHSIKQENRPYSPYTSDHRYVAMSSGLESSMRQTVPSSPTFSASSVAGSIPSLSSMSVYSASSTSAPSPRLPPLSSPSDTSLSSLARNEPLAEDHCTSALEETQRDEYGFKRPTQWVTEKQLCEFEQQYRPILEHQQAKWKALLEEHDDQLPPISPSLKRLVRRGIPNSLRGRCWMHYSGARAKMEAHPGLYDSLLNTALSMGDQNEYVEIIERDLHRTFPDNHQFACAVSDDDGSVTMVPDTNPKLKQMRNVLLAFTVHSPQIGYCQSLNYLVGFFLLFLEREEEVFWMLVITIHDILPQNMYDVTMEGANIDQTVLMHMIYERIPSIWNKVANGKCFWECEQADRLPTITLVTSHWFLTMFINIVPVETVLRIWDCIFLEGYKVLFLTALTIIKLSEQKIWALDDVVDMFQILQDAPRRLIQCHQFIDRVFSRSSLTAGISMQEIKRKRGFFRERRRQRRATQGLPLV